MQSNLQRFDFAHMLTSVSCKSTQTNFLVQTILFSISGQIKNDTRYLNRQSLTPKTDGLDYIKVFFWLSHKK